MSITATRVATHLRTWLLLAALTALLIATGGAIGGAGLYVFIVLAVGMHVAGYWFSDRIALAASRARPVEAGRRPELEAMVEDLARRAEVPVPRLHIIPSPQPNAFTTGRDPEHAALAVTEGLLDHLSDRETRAVLAHEFGHIKNRDILVSSMAAMVAGAVSAVASVLQFSMLFGASHEEDAPLGLLGTLVTIIVAPIAATLLQLAVSRQLESLADATAAQLLGRAAPLADPLATLERGSRALPMDVNPATASLYAGQTAAPRRTGHVVHDPSPDRRAHPAPAGSGHPARRPRHRLARVLGTSKPRPVPSAVAGPEGRLSDELEAWLTGPAEKTLGSLADAFGEKSFPMLFALLLAVPALPLPTVGVSHVFEVIAVLLALELVLGRPEVWLPRRWRAVDLSGDRQTRLITGLVSLIRRLEGLSRPRLRALLHHRLTAFGFGLLVIAGAVGAFLAPPFSGLDTLPALGVVVLSLGVVLEDAAIAGAGALLEVAGIAVEIAAGAAAVHGVQSLI